MRRKGKRGPTGGRGSAVVAEPPDQRLQPRLLDAHLAQVRHRVADVVGAGAGRAVAVADAFQDDRLVQVARVLLVLGPGDVAPSLGGLVGAEQGHGQEQAVVDVGAEELALVEVGGDFWLAGPGDA